MAERSRLVVMHPSIKKAHQLLAGRDRQRDEFARYETAHGDDLVDAWLGQRAYKQKDANDASLTYKTRDDALVTTDYGRARNIDDDGDLTRDHTPEQLAQAVNLGDVLHLFNVILPVVGGEQKHGEHLLRRALEDQIAELSDRVAALEDRVAELEGSQLEGGGDGS
jgi:hypothetical protein